MKATAACLAALLAFSFAGCVENNAISTAGAMDALETARAKAGEYMESPELVLVGAVEPFKNYVYEDTQILVHADDVVGDGRAPMWFYEFYGNETSVTIITMSGGYILAEVIQRNVTDYEEEYFIRDWNYDSVETALLLNEDSRWPDIREQDTVFWELSMEDGIPYWFVEVVDIDTWGGYYAVVDAKNGTILEIEENEGYAGGDYDSYSTEVIYYSGVVLQTAPFISGFTLTDEGYVSLMLDVNPTLPGDLSFVLERDGAVIAEYNLPAGLSAGRYEYCEYELPAGCYTLMISTGLAKDVTLLCFYGC